MSQHCAHVVLVLHRKDEKVLVQRHSAVYVFKEARYRDSAPVETPCPAHSLRVPPDSWTGVPPNPSGPEFAGVAVVIHSLVLQSPMSRPSFVEKSICSCAKPQLCSALLFRHQAKLVAGPPDGQSGFLQYLIPLSRSPSSPQPRSGAAPFAPSCGGRPAEVRRGGRRLRCVGASLKRTRRLLLETRRYRLHVRQPRVVLAQAPAEHGAEHLDRDGGDSWYPAFAPPVAPPG